MTLQVPGVKNLVFEQVTIGLGTSVGTAIDTQGRAVCGVIMPAAWDAASLRWSAGMPGALQPVFDNAAVRVATKAAAGQYVMIPAANVFFAPGIQLESCDAAGATPVNQTAARAIIVILREVL